MVKETIVTDTDNYVLPMLYNIDKKNKERYWKIWCVNNAVCVKHGEVNGESTSSKRKYEGANIDKSNGTTPNEQAKRVAERKWISQLDTGYHPKSKEGKELFKKIQKAKKEQGNTNTNLYLLIRGKELPKAKKAINKDDGIIRDFETDFLPMHCHKWEEKAKCLKYFDFENGVYIQPKVDGIRSFAKIHNGNVIFISRQGKQFKWLKHLREEFLLFLEGNEDILPDFELYAEEIKGKVKEYKKDKPIFETSSTLTLNTNMRFSAISGACKMNLTKPHIFDNQICAYIFDIADETGKLTQTERFKILNKLFKSENAKKCKHIKRVKTKIIHSIDEMNEYHDEVFDKGYEGVVLRSKDMLYESKRKSLKMRKHKYDNDEEYVIVGIKHDKGVPDEQFVFKCEIEVDGEIKYFYPKPMGDKEQKLEWFNNSDELVGKLLTVIYQEISNKGIPRFPRGKCIRDYE